MFCHRVRVFHITGANSPVSNSLCLFFHDNIIFTGNFQNFATIYLILHCETFDILTVYTIIPYIN